MKRLAIILTFPYLVPATIALCIKHLWAFATNKEAGSWMMSGGKVSDYYILLPLALVIQILAGLPGSLIMCKTSSRQTAIVCAALLPVLPFLFIRADNGMRDGFSGFLLPLLGIIGLFGVGSCVSFYFLFHRRIKIAEHVVAPNGP